MRVNKGGKSIKVLQDVVVAKVSKTMPNPTTRVLDEITADGIKAYSEKGGWWRIYVLHTIDDPIVLGVLNIFASVRSVVELAANLLKGEGADRARSWPTGLHQVQLVCSQGMPFYNDYKRLGSLEWLSDELAEYHSGDDVVKWLWELAIDSVWWNSIEFYRRIVEPTLHFLDMLLWFMFSLPDTRCRHRQQVAENMRAGKHLDSNAMTILELLGSDIDDAISTGLCTFRLWLLVYNIAHRPH